MSQRTSPQFSKVARLTALAIACAHMAGCAMHGNWLPSSGPRLDELRIQPNETGLQSPLLIDLDADIVARRSAAQKEDSFSRIFSEQALGTGQPLGPGDAIEVTVWEAPPATLLASMPLETRGGGNGARAALLPDQVVAEDGTISIPFGGVIQVLGRTPRQVEAQIAASLSGKSHQPQVAVRILRHASHAVTVVGEVAHSMRLPLTPKGERLLDALASAGGTRQPVGKVSIQVARGGVVASMPMDRVIRDPAQNLRLMPDDVVTVVHQPFSLTVLGATGTNREIEFEAQGISVAQALGRAGGLQDLRADARAVLLFRLESAASLATVNSVRLQGDKAFVPVIYRIDLRAPAGFFAAREFPVQDKDILFVSNATAADLQKFLSIISSTIAPAAMVRNLVN